MLRKTLVSLLLIFPLLVSAAWASSYGAIAYSPKTGRYGFTYNYPHLGDAENDAIAKCNASDATIVAWARNEWCALAISDEDDSYGYSSGDTKADAESSALANVNGKGHILCVVFAGD